MSNTTGASPAEKERDRQGNSSFKQGHHHRANHGHHRTPSVPNNRIAHSGGVTDSAAVTRQQNPATVSSAPRGGAPPMLSASSGPVSEGHHHPDLPFLVTHWLSQYAPSSLSHSLPTASKTIGKMPGALDKMITLRKDQTEEKVEALRKIRQAASDLASAFQTLEAFGHSRRADTPLFSRPTTYSDLSRKYSPLLSAGVSSFRGIDGNGNRFNRYGNRRKALLDTVISASSSAHAVAAKNDLKCIMPWSLLEAAREGSVPTEDLPNGKVKETTSIGSGRTVGEDLSLNSETAMDNLVPPGEFSDSAMQIPILLGSNAGDASAGHIGAMSTHAAQASRRHLSLRIEAALQRKQMECAVQTMRTTMDQAQKRRPVDLMEQVGVDPNLDIHRVLAQLERRVHEVYSNLSSTYAKVAETATAANKSYRDLATFRRQYQDSYQLNGEQASIHQILNVRPGQRNLGFGLVSHTPGKNNIALAATLTRQYHDRHLPSTNAETNLSVLKSRLSHAATISCHLIYPVYCLKFDKTGKYFITGADDQVAKLFHLGAGQKEICSVHDGCGTESNAPAFNYGANVRGAVLVCALRGHAGVVADIDVNVDNALVATASGDGDVRVWGLKDGCPVAILRGHKNGANMVSWSTLTPFRLVTCGEDGLARMWDVRKAALKRYGNFIDNWAHYSGPVQEFNTAHQGMAIGLQQENSNQVSLSNPSYPPSQEERSEDNTITMNNLAGNEIGRNNGAFVANSQIDEGVALIAQLQHGALVEENVTAGRVTRTASKAVKVMCIARCPLGGHFATGSDDGLGRVWADDDDWHVERLDRELSDFDAEDGMAIHTSNSTFLRMRTNLNQSNAPSEERLLATLRGHTNAVTDMMYSSAGDRILTASMKDGIVCVWSLGKEGMMTSIGNLASPTTSDFHPGPMYAKFSNVSQLSILLTHESRGGGGSSTIPASRQKATPANCDGVTWTCDDMKIVTSQSSPAKAGSGEIIPGSQMIYIWDSHSVKCLMGIMSSHSSLCSALAPHPTLSSVIASAGSDGVVNVWDLDRGDCFCTHTNTLSYGPAEPATDRGKQCGYLDVQFSPNGLHLVLTDENGRVTILDTLVPAMLRTGADTAVAGRYSITSWSSSTPAWMKEQYFASDYYELFYETNGYCVERGSELPPHIAPKGVRCTHEGISHSENIREVYRQLEGPLPLPHSSVRWHRDDIRAQSTQVRLKGVFISGNAHKKPKKIVGNTELYQGRGSTAIINMRGQLVQPERIDPSFTNSNSRGPRITGSRSLSNSTSTGSHLSSRYRWVGFADVPETEDENEEHSDDAYEGNGRILEESSSEDDNRDGVSRPHRRPRSVRGRGRLGQSRRRERSVPAGESQEQRRRTRASSRRIAQQTYHELNSDDEHLNEMMSTHTIPSGNFKEDWLTSEHLFKMPRGEGCNVSRDWLSRIDYQGACIERKLYCPQVGDSVVYVPRAHYDTLQKYPFPNYSMPWKSWPTHFSWPVVWCKVTHIRYRFPYKLYYKGRCQDEKLQGVAAILTLRIYGVPSQPAARDFPWPAPNFTPLSSDLIEFEVTMFECDEDDFIIPEYLYSWRIKELERAIVANDRNADGISVTMHCPPDDDDYLHSTDDIDRLGYTGHLLHILERSEDEFHFTDSGYNALSMKWDMDEDNQDTNEHTVSCAWSISVSSPSCDIPVVPTMGEDVKKAVKAAFRTVINLDPKVKECFYDHVDTRKYTDYLEMIEVPMCLSRIRQRLRNDYYTNTSSVVADMELVKENCYKYNEDGDGYYELACRMYDKFKYLVHSINENDATSQIHSSKSTSAFGSTSLETSQEQPPFSSISVAQKHHSGDCIPNLDSVSDSSDRRMISHDDVPGKPEPCAQAGIGDELDTGTSDDEDGQQEDESKTEVRSRSKPSSNVRVTENVARRSTRRSAQRLQAIKVSCPSPRVSLREKKKSIYAEEDSEEDGNSESSSEEENDEINRDEEVSTGKDTESDECKSDDEDGHQQEEPKTKVKFRRKPDSHIPVQDNVAYRQTRRSSQQLTEVECPSRNLRARTKTNYVENSEEEEIPESSSEDESDERDEEVTTDEDTLKTESSACARNNKELVTKTSDDDDRHKKEQVLRRSTRRSAQQLKPTELRGPSRRKNSRAWHSTKKVTAKAKPFAKSANSKESDAELSDDVDGNHQNKKSFQTKIRSRRKPSIAAHKPPGRPVKKLKTSEVGLPSRRISLRARSKASYVEKDSDDEEILEISDKEEHNESESDSVDEVSTEEEVVSPRKRKGRQMNDDAPRKRGGRALAQKKGSPNYPDLVKWPPISKRKIPEVGIAVLNKLGELDTLNLFCHPVCEEFPDVADRYLREVKNPMDFHTIEHGRLSKYVHISQLQEDLILTFRNCCVFNQESSEYYSYALKFWETLNDVFNEVCVEKEIRSVTKSRNW